MNLPQHRLGVHFIPVHGRNSDWDYIQKLRPPIVKIINPDPNEVSRALTMIDPAGYVWLRDHPLSEQKDDLNRDPIGTGIRHANEWYSHLTGRFAAVFDPKRIIVSGINEPFVRGEEEETKVLHYTAAMLDRATELGFKVAALNLSVGWPRNLGTDQPPYWGGFLPLEAKINRGGHFLALHSYWYSTPSSTWFTRQPAGDPPFGWLGYRENYCPFQCPIIIGECGMEKMVDINRWNNEGRPPKGWDGNISPETFADQLWEYAEKTAPNVFAITPFTTDWGSNDFQSMDTSRAHNAILARKRNHTWPAVWPAKPPHHDRIFGGIVTPPDPTPGVVLPPFDFSKGRFVRGFGAADGHAHNGVDIGMAEGVPLVAMADGIVAWSDTDTAANGGYGQYIRIYYPSLGMDSFYAHLSQRLVKTGDKVSAGQVVGRSGNTGNSTDPHLHLEFRRKDAAAPNPLSVYLFSHWGNGRTDPMAILHMLGWPKPF